MSTSYYVANAGHGGNDGNPGTIGSPFATFTHAVSVAIAGDSIFLNGGDTFTESVSIAVVLASLSSYGTGLATIVSTALTNNTISFTAPPTSVTNLNVQGTSSVFANTGNHGFRIGTTGTTVYAGCTISGCNFSNIPSNAVVFTHATADAGGVTGITITGNTFNNCGAIGVQLTGSAGTKGVNYYYSGVTIANNTISNILGNTSASGSSYGWGIVLQYVNVAAGASIVHDNVLHDLGLNCNAAQAGGGTAFQCEGCTGVQIYNNVAYNLFNTVAAGSDGGLGYDIDVSCLSCVCYDNYVYNADGPALACYSASGAGTFFTTTSGSTSRVARRSAVFISAATRPTCS